MTKLHLNPPQLAKIPERVGPGELAKVLHTLIIPKNLVRDSLGIIADKKAPLTLESIDPMQALATKATKANSIVGTKANEIVNIWAGI